MCLELAAGFVIPGWRPKADKEHLSACRHVWAARLCKWRVWRALTGTGRATRLPARAVLLTPAGSPLGLASSEPLCHLAVAALIITSASPE